MQLSASLVFKSMFERLRAGIIGGDPGLVRFRMAARVTSTVSLVALALTGLHGVITLPTSCYAIGITLALQNALAVKDPTSAQRAQTRVLCAVAGWLAFAVVASLRSSPVVVNVMFLGVTFLAVYARRWGNRWNAVGMFGFMAWFSGAYFKPELGDIVSAILALALSGLVAHLVRDVLIPDRPLFDLRQTLSSVEERIAHFVSCIRVGQREGWTTATRRNAIAAENRVKDAIAATEGLLPEDAGNLISATGAPALAVKLFDLHLATETVLVAGLDVRTGDEASTASLASALNRLAKARMDMRHQMQALTIHDLTGPRAATPTAPQSKSEGWFSDPSLRLATQVTLASALAMGGGFWISEQRWFWAVLTAFLVFTNTQSRGDTLVRGLDRALGTGFGIAVGIALAVLLHGAFGVSVLLIAICIFLAFYLLQLSYGALTFFVTIALSLLYGLLGSFSPELLLLRLEETLVGAAAGMFVSFFVFPRKTEGTVRRAIDGFLLELDRLLETFEDYGRGNASAWKVLAVSRALDRRHSDIAAAVRPLADGWIVLPRRQLIRTGVLRFTALAYWSHRLAGAAANTITPISPDWSRMQSAIRLCRAEIASLREGSGDFFRLGEPDDLRPPERLSSPIDFAAAEFELALHAVRHILGQAAAEPKSAKKYGMAK